MALDRLPINKLAFYSISGFVICVDYDSVCCPADGETAWCCVGGRA